MAGSTYKRFIVLSTARTGSSLLVQALNSHPSIVCFRELFNGRHDFVDFSVEGYDNFSAREHARRAEDPVAFLHERVFCQWPADVAAVGFKLLYGQTWDFKGVVDHLGEDEELLVLHLQRRNPLRTLTSFKLARETDVWFEDAASPPVVTRSNVMRALRSPGAAWQAVRRRMRRSTVPTAQRRPRITITPDELFVFEVETQIRSKNYAALFARERTLDVFYEDLVERRNETLAAAQEFLGVDAVELSTTLQRQNPEPLSELIENYEDLRAFFSDKMEAAFFDG